MADVKGLSRIRRTGLVVFLFSGFVLCKPFPVFATKNVTLAWTAPGTTNIAGYRIYYGTASRRYTSTVSVTNMTTGTVPALTEGTTYFFAATAYNTLGLQSDFSPEVAYFVTEPNPPVIRIDGPPDDSQFATSTVTVWGTAADDVRVEQVVVRVNNGPWQNATLGGTPTSRKWTNSVTLTAAATNTVEVMAVDSSANESVPHSLRLFQVVPSSLTVNVNGSGSLSPNYNASVLNVGQTYTMTAAPGINCLFINWTKIVNGVTNVLGSSTYLTFLMESNLVLTANFTTNRLIDAAGTYYGLFSDTAGVAHQSAGFFRLKTTSYLTFSGKLQVDGQIVGCVGAFDPSGRGVLKRLATRNGKPPLSVTLQLALDGSDLVTGVISNTSGAWVAEMLGSRDVFAKTPIPTSYVGQYTMVIAGLPNAPRAPPGDGYALITIKNNGQVVCAGGLGDGCKLRAVASAMSKNGDWPLHAMMYREPYTYTNGDGVTKNSYIYKGSIIGWMRFADRPSRTLEDASLIWIKTALPANNLYPAGFTNEVDVFGSAYTAPAAGQRALNLTTGIVTVRDGNLSRPFTNDVFLEPDNRVTVMPPDVNLQKLVLTARNGRIKSTFYHPNNAAAIKPTAAYGAVLQDASEARGYFVGTNQTGSVRLRRK